MRRILLMALAIQVFLVVTALGQSMVTVHFFLPGGGALDRETEVLLRTGSIEDQVRTGKDGRLEIKRQAGSNPVCRIVVQADKRNYAETDITFRLLDGLTDTPVFLAPLEMPKLPAGGKDLEAFDAGAPAEAKEAYSQARAAGSDANPGLAISQYTRAISLYPKYLRAINHLGMLFYERRRMDEAAAAFTQALSLGSSYPYPAFNLGATRLQQGRSGEAIAVLIDLLDKNPGMSEARLPLAGALMATQQWDEAALQLRNMLEDDSLSNETRSRGHIELAKIYTREERYQSSLNEALKALAARPDGPNAVQSNLLIGSSLLQLKRFDEAESALIAAYSADQTGAISAQLLLGQLYYEQKKYDQALKAFELYLKTAPASTNTPLVRQSIEMIKSQMKPRQN